MFFDRFRQDLRRYADGVHDLGEPASAGALSRLPAPLRELYRSWNGVRLFADSIVLGPAERLTSAEGGGWQLGEAFGAALVLDDGGHIYELDDAGDRLLQGSTVERWLNAHMAREALVIDREGEFKDVFDADALTDEVRRKRVRAALKADPSSAAWQLEAADLAVEEGEIGDARAALEAAVAADPGAGAAWAMLGGLERRAGAHGAAEQAYARAAEATRDPARRAERAAEAARAARAAGGDGEAHAARARTAQPGAGATWRAQARERLDEGDLDGAIDLAERADAVGEPEAAALARRARTKRSLKVV
jgi:tetratricopeptide (TPR) repeat protein